MKLRKLLNEIDSLAHKAKMELINVERESESIKKDMEKMQAKRSEKCSSKISTNTKSLEGKTIDRIVSVGDFWGDYNHLLIECSDGTRVAVAGLMDSRRIHNISLEDMIKSTFFTKEEIKAKEEKDNREKQNRENDNKRRKQQELERLQKELKED